VTFYATYEREVVMVDDMPVVCWRLSPRTVISASAVGVYMSSGDYGCWMNLDEETRHAWAGLPRVHELRLAVFQHETLAAGDEPHSAHVEAVYLGVLRSKETS
jgi:hypothetical protein